MEEGIYDLCVRERGRCFERCYVLCEIALSSAWCVGERGREWVCVREKCSARCYVLCDIIWSPVLCVCVCERDASTGAKCCAIVLSVAWCVEERGRGCVRV